MDLKLLEYIVAIDEHRNITKAAEAMFISQSGLNQQLIHLEKELGTQLFTRNKRFVTPTAAGRIYVKYAREMLHMKRLAYAELMDIKDNISGDIYWGLTYEHGVDLFLYVSEILGQKYPGLTIHLGEHSVSTLNRMLQRDELDLAFVMLREEDEQSGFEYTKLCREKLLVGVPVSFPEAQGAAPRGEPLKRVPLSRFRERRFSLMFGGSTQRNIIDELFRKADIDPKLFCETRMNRTLRKLVEHQNCCAIIPQSYAEYHESIAWFEIEGESYWDWNLCWKKGQAISRPTQLLMDLARQYAQQIEGHWKKEVIGNPFRS